VEHFPQAGPHASDPPGVRTVSREVSGQSAAWPQPAERPRDVRGVLLAVVAAFVLVLGSFTWVLSRQAHRSSGAITQLPATSGQGGIRGVGPTDSRGLTTQPGQPGTGPGLATQPTPQTGGPPVTQTPNANPNGPNVLGTPSQNENGPSVVGSVPTMPTGPPMLRGPRGLSTGPPVTRAPATPNSGPPVTTTPNTAPQGPPVVASPRSAPEVRPQPALDDISGYLQRLRVVEQRRRVLEAQLITIVTNTTFAQALGAMTQMNEGEEQAQFPRQAVMQFAGIAREYDNLAIGFQRFTRPVPVSCALLHATYGRALSQMPGIVRTLQGAIVRRDMGTAMLVQQFANGTVDRNFAVADSELARLTRERGIPKPFDLGSGTGGGLMSPFGP
jgi:hypothetical protein